MKGPGKYDPECSALQEQFSANGVLLAVLGGKDRGSGFSVAATQDVLIRLPGLLRSMADQIEADMGGSHEQKTNPATAARSVP